MKRFAIAVALVLACVYSAGAEDNGIGQLRLSSMGLPSLKVMSDAEGYRVRGTAAGVYGSSVVSSTITSGAGNSTSSTSAFSFYAGASTKNSAVGVNGAGSASFAGQFTTFSVAKGFATVVTQ